MLPLNTTTHSIYGQQHPTQHPLRPIPLSSVAFVETSESCQSVPWTYHDMPPLAPNPYYPPCQFMQVSSITNMQNFEFMDDALAVELINPMAENSDCSSGISQEAILAEIVRECEMIECNSSPERLSSPSTGYSSEDSDSVPVFGKLPAKKERKKAQNREAATRYREKKRKERVIARLTIDGLLDRNDELRKKAESIQGEIDFLKKLMAEVGISKDSVQYISPIAPL